MREYGDTGWASIIRGSLRPLTPSFACVVSFYTCHFWPIDHRQTKYRAAVWYCNLTVPSGGSYATQARMDTTALLETVCAYALRLTENCSPRSLNLAEIWWTRALVYP